MNPGRNINDMKINFFEREGNKNNKLKFIDSICNNYTKLKKKSIAHEIYFIKKKGNRMLILL